MNKERTLQEILDIFHIPRDAFLNGEKILNDLKSRGLINQKNQDPKEEYLLNRNLIIFK